MDADRSIKDKDQMSPRSREGSLSGVSPALATKQPRSSIPRLPGPVTGFTSNLPKLSPLGSPTGLRSPRFASPGGSSTNLAESTPRPVLYKPTQRPSTPQRGGELHRLPPSSISRTFSSDTASSPSSAGPPISPTDTRPIHRAGGRVWDPARGVEIFKKGSEEVLSRFLKMGSWEEEKQSPSQSLA
jgi:glycogenin glucosyltransferase